MREKRMGYGFDVNSFVDSLDSYSVFDDVADSMDFASVGISTVDPNAQAKKKVESNKKNTNKTKGLVKNSLKKRGRKPGQKPRCGSCGILGHTRRKCAA